MTITPKINTDTFKVSVRVVSGKGTGYASEDGSTVTAALVGKMAQNNCVPVSEALPGCAFFRMILR